MSGYSIPGLLLLALSADVATAQLAGPAENRGRPLWSVAAGGHHARPIGGFRSNVEEAWGLGVTVRRRFAGFQPLAVRADVALLNYGNERERVPLSGSINRVLVDMTTSNNIAVLSGGPELRATRGALRPYLYGFAGYSSFYTQSSVGSDRDGEAFASSTNLSDGGLAAGWGGGVEIPFRIRKAHVAVDAGARRTWNGSRTYLRRGDIIDQPDGSMVLQPRTTDADFWQFHVGVSFAFTGR